MTAIPKSQLTEFSYSGNLPADDEEFGADGLFYWIGTQGRTTAPAYVNPVSNGGLSVKASSNGGGKSKTENIFSRKASVFYTSNSQDSWFCFELGNGLKFKPTRYLYRNPVTAATSQPPRNWEFQGSNDGSSWTTLSKHIDDKSIGHRVPSQCATWETSASSYYSHFRIFQDGPNGDGKHYLACGGMELYGTLWNPSKVAMAKSVTTRMEIFSCEYNGTLPSNTDNLHPGIFYFIGSGRGTSTYSNPHSTGSVVVKMSSNGGGQSKPSGFVSNSPATFYSKNEPNQWISVDVGDSLLVAPTYYCIRNAQTGATSQPLRSWELQGSNDEVSWETLCKHTNESHLGHRVAGMCGAWGVNVGAESYRYFRIFQFDLNGDEKNYLACGGMELYGKVYDVGCIPGIAARRPSVAGPEVSSGTRKKSFAWSQVVPGNDDPYDQSGLLFWLGTGMGCKEYQNPHEAGSVVCKWSSDGGNKSRLSNFLNHEPGVIYSANKENQWFSVDLGKHICFRPNRYMIRNARVEATSQALRNWEFQGSNNGIDWEVLRRHEKDETIKHRVAGQVGTWEISTDKGFRHFRIYQFGPNSDNKNYLSCGGIELYGELGGGVGVQNAFAFSGKMPEDGESFDMNGVLYWLGTKKGTRAYQNPHTSGAVVAKMSSFGGAPDRNKVESLVSHTAATVYTENKELSWLSVDLGVDVRLCPNFYVIRSAKQNATSVPLRNWSFEGSHDDITWTTIRRHSNDTALPVSVSARCAGWELSTSEAFRFFRLYQFGKNGKSNHYCACGGIELYGSLVSASAAGFGRRLVSTQEAHQSIINMFRQFDLDENGCLDAAELGKLLRSLDPGTWTDDKVAELISKMDVNRDGQIQIDEWLEWMRLSGADQSNVKAKMGIDSVRRGISNMQLGCKFMQLGEWRMGQWNEHFAIVHRGKVCALFSPSGETMFGQQVTSQDPKDMWGLAIDGGGDTVAFGDRFIQLGDWRVGSPINDHFVIAHKGCSSGAMMLVNGRVSADDGHNSKCLWGKDPGDVVLASGEDFVELGAWRFGQVDGHHFCFTFKDKPVCALLLRKDGTSHPGPRDRWPPQNRWLLDKPLTLGSANLAQEDIFPPSYWTNWRDGSGGSAMFDQMCSVTSDKVPIFQDLLNRTYRAKSTGDRKCPKKEDRCPRTPGGCPCVQPGGTPGMPSGYRVRKVIRVEDSTMWSRYVIKKGELREKRGDSAREFDPPVEVNEIAQEHPNIFSPLEYNINETYLWHGTFVRFALSIGQDNFRLNLAGSNAGTMYGRGAYLAEHFTKADEYADDEPGGYYEGVHAVLLCRAVMGKMFYTTRRDENAGQRIKTGEFDSTLGDRMKSVDTFREMVLYNVDQLYPEYIVLYNRLYGGETVVSSSVIPRELHLELPVYWRNIHHNPNAVNFDVQCALKDAQLHLLEKLLNACYTGGDVWKQTKDTGAQLQLVSARRVEKAATWNMYNAFKISLRKEVACPSDTGPRGPESVGISVGDKFIQLGDWRIGETDGGDFAICHRRRKCALILKPNEQSHRFGPHFQPSEHQALWNRELRERQDVESVKLGKDFIQVGEWRFGELGNEKLVFAHSSNAAKMVLRGNGSKGVRGGVDADEEASSLWDRDVAGGATELKYGKGFIEFVWWRIGQADKSHFAFTNKIKPVCALILRSDGTAHEGPRDRWPPQNELLLNEPVLSESSEGLSVDEAPAITSVFTSAAAIDGSEDDGHVLTASGLDDADPEDSVSSKNLESDINELFLWHGTSSVAAEAIARTGFQIKHGAELTYKPRFGEGAYFAETLDKSLHYAEKEGSDQWVLLCRVVCGNFYYTTKDREDDAHEKCGHKYHCVLAVPPEGSHREFIVQKAEQVYPEYILQVRTG